MTLFRNVLVPYDFSPDADRALRVALELDARIRLGPPGGS